MVPRSILNPLRTVCRSAMELLHAEHVLDREDERSSKAPGSLRHDSLRHRRDADIDPRLGPGGPGPPAGVGFLGLDLLLHGVFVHDARADDAAVPSALVADARASVESDALELPFEPGVRSRRAPRAGQLVCACDARSASDDFLRAFLLGGGGGGGELASVRPSASSSTFERVRLGGEPVERELRVGHVVEALGLSNVEASLEKIQSLEDLADIRARRPTSASRARAGLAAGAGDPCPERRDPRVGNGRTRRPSRPARRVSACTRATSVEGLAYDFSTGALSIQRHSGEHVAATTRLGLPPARCKSRRAARRARTRLSRRAASVAGGAGRVNVPSSNRL